MRKVDAELGTNLFERDRRTAIRIVEWFGVLYKLRRAAEKVPAEDLFVSLKHADLKQIEHDYHWLMIMLRERFELGQEELERLGNLDRIRFRQPRAFTDEKFDNAAANSKNDKDIVRQLKVSPSTVSRYKKKRGIS